jgi:hypothetical protein
MFPHSLCPLSLRLFPCLSRSFQSSYQGDNQLFPPYFFFNFSSLTRSFQSSYQGDSNFLEQLTGEK